MNKTRRGTDKADVTCSWLAQDLRNGRRLIGCGVKTSFLIMCEFNFLRINVYWRNNKGRYFLGNPHIAVQVGYMLSVKFYVLI